VPQVVLWRDEELTESAREPALSGSGLAVVEPPLAVPVVAGQACGTVAPRRHAVVACFVAAVELPVAAGCDAQFQHAATVEFLESVAPFFHPALTAFVEPFRWSPVLLRHAVA